jgi:hypothetical protein
MTAPNHTDIDAMLTAMLAPPTRPGDRTFTVQVERAIDAQAAYARARARFWRSFGFEALAVGALLAALWLLSSVPLPAPLAGATHWGLASPLLLILLLWFGVQRWRSA